MHSLEFAVLFAGGEKSTGERGAGGSEEFNVSDASAVSGQAGASADRRELVLAQSTLPRHLTHLPRQPAPAGHRPCYPQGRYGPCTQNQLHLWWE